MGEAAGQGIACPTISAALTARNLSALKAERLAASKTFEAPKLEPVAKEQRAAFIEDVKNALYASKICSYTQGMNLIRAMGLKKGWDLDLGKIASIWKGGLSFARSFWIALPRRT